MVKNFFLGVGAQKSGTTWLQRYLSQYSNFDFGPVKEYHTWDTLYVYKSTRYMNLLGPIRTNIINNNPPYEQYFSDLIKDKVNSTGDITPGYCELKSNHFSIIKEKLESVGFNVKIIFLMRDPFERCCSAAKMDIMKNADNAVDRVDDNSFLAYRYTKNVYTARTDYESTITELERVFAPDQIYYGIYEEMFTKEKIDELSKFCGVIPNYDFASINTNPSEPFSGEIDESLKKEIINFFSEVYEFCYERFPQTKILWNKNN